MLAFALCTDDRTQLALQTRRHALGVATLNVAAHPIQIKRGRLRSALSRFSRGKSVSPLSRLPDFGRQMLPGDSGHWAGLI
jgi:hypothetical protein